LKFYLLSSKFLWARGDVKKFKGCGLLKDFLNIVCFWRSITISGGSFDKMDFKGCFSGIGLSGEIETVFLE
jgi:hypothetical protein